MNVYSLLRPLLFRLDAEQAHELVFRLLAIAEAGLSRLPTSEPPDDPLLTQHLWGLRFANPIGLAAGLDKNARAPHVWPRLGFGFAELGTITAHAQPGNPRPRLFRFPVDRALINRMGFNNDGAAAVAARLALLLARRAASIPIGINLGKSKITALEAAAEDYSQSLRHLFPFADYVVINVSSPNTPGLRDLQAEEQLVALLQSVDSTNRRLADQSGVRPRPVLVKVAPDLTDEALQRIVDATRSHGGNGLIATNTTITRGGLSSSTDEAGGLSGAPLRHRATEVIRLLHRTAGNSLAIIGVGGVFHAEDVYEKIRAGASLVQIYTGLIYEGPSLPGRLVEGLRTLLRRDAISHVSEAIGRDV